MHIKLLLICLFWYLYHQEELADAGALYFDTERPVVTYFDQKYFRYLKVTSLRQGREDPRHYTSFYLEFLKPFGKNITVDIYFYQLLTNRYRPSFVEMHFNFCDMVNKDPFFGSQIKKNLNKFNVSCPFPPGKYNLTDMAIPIVPKNFPFVQGRIYVNLTLDAKPSNILLVNAHIDMEIKQIYLKSKKN